MRGEYRSILRLHHGSVELPPRARRILPDRHTPIWGLGTTSACAENTTLLVKYVAPPWNYLRVRGEYPRPVVTPPFIWELPPRARRILQGGVTWATGHGTTSACAENTWDHAEAQPINRNYLRVRGEYLGFMGAGPPFLELPPRARRILTVIGGAAIVIGTTSACAENTGRGTANTILSWNYLRVRGEYPRTGKVRIILWELPPRARRIRTVTVGGVQCDGTTSACAENTPNHATNHGGDRNYLRVRGEYVCFSELCSP